MFAPSRKNELLKLVQEAGLNPRNFAIKSLTGPDGVQLTHKSTGFYFQCTLESIGRDTAQREVMRLALRSVPKPGIVPNAREIYVTTNIEDWDTAKKFCLRWVLLIRDEFEQPDLWAELEEGPEMFAEHADIPDEPFSAAEIKLLTQRVAEVEERIEELEFSPEATAAIRQVIHEVPEKAKRLTKKELSETVIGSLVKEGIKWGLTYEHISSAWQTCLHLFEVVSKQLQ